MGSEVSCFVLYKSLVTERRIEFHGLLHMTIFVSVFGRFVSSMMVIGHRTALCTYSVIYF